MIVNIDGTRAIWFGYVLSPEKEIPYDEAVYLLMEIYGYTKEMIRERHKEAGGDTMAARIGKHNKPPKTEEDFIQSAFHYISAFSADPDKKKVASLIGAHVTFKSVDTASSMAKTIYEYFATK